MGPDPHLHRVCELLLDELPQLLPAQGAAVAVASGTHVESSNDAIDVFLELGHLPAKLRQPARKNTDKKGLFFVCLFAWFSDQLLLNSTAGQAERERRAREGHR